jgi:membrane protease YdiL (CAAX protease family)
VFGASAFAMAFGLSDAGADGINKFIIAGVVLCVVLVPIQAAAEEYLYRGLLMQAIGSWTKLPALAIVLSAIVFGISHSYGVLGVTAVGISGLGFAFLAWYCRGLEAAAQLTPPITSRYSSSPVSVWRQRGQAESWMS